MTVNHISSHLISSGFLNLFSRAKEPQRLAIINRYISTYLAWAWAWGMDDVVVLCASPLSLHPSRDSSEIKGVYRNADSFVMHFYSQPSAR